MYLMWAPQPLAPNDTTLHGEAATALEAQARAYREPSTARAGLAAAKAPMPRRKPSLSPEAARTAAAAPVTTAVTDARTTPQLRIRRTAIVETASRHARAKATTARVGPMNETQSRATRPWTKAAHAAAAVTATA